MDISALETSRIQEVDFDNLTFGTVFTDHMFYSEYKNGAWQNMEIKPYGPLTITPALHTLHYGQALFEGQKAYRQQDGSVAIFRPEMNARRMNHSAKRMFVPEFPEEDFLKALKELVGLDSDWVPHQKDASLYLRPFMYGSSEFIAARPSEEYVFCIIMSPVAAYYSGSVKVKIEETYTRSATGGVGSTKCAGNYGGAFYPTHLAKEQGYTQVIWTDHANHELVEESGTMNIAFIIDGTFITPPLSDRILPGITRDSILTLLREEKMIDKVEERPIKVEEVVKAAKEGRIQEAFGMGTAAVISPIDTIAFRDTDFSIPTPDDGLGIHIKKRLSDIRYGRVEDPYGWMLKV